jgi:NAD+ synthase (glutamine-hydrolysing)
MKIALAQLNYKIGDIENNERKIIEEIEKAKEQKVDLILFSELAVTAYDPQDWLEFENFIDKAQKAIERIKNVCDGIVAIVGAPTINKTGIGKRLYNSAIVMEDKEIKKVINKTSLPTYDIFWDYRYFEPNRTFELVEICGKQVGITICEDIWDVQEFTNDFIAKNPYRLSPVEELVKLNPDLILNLSASPFAHDKDEARKNTVISKAKEYKMPFVYVNQVGANTDIIYDGGSFACNNKGDLVEELNYFEEDFRVIDSDLLYKASSFVSEPKEVYSKIEKALVLGIRDYFKKTGLKKAILGLSGGIDSALVLVLLQRALGAENVKSVLMPSKYSSDHSISDSIELSENLGTAYDIISIEDAVDSFERTLAKSFQGTQVDVTEENIQARSRGVILMAYSNKFGFALVNTSNKSEVAVGYSTLYGDMNGALSILGDLYKTHVYGLSRFINKDKEIIPWNIITKPPSAELRPDQKDSDTLPDYDLLDAMLYKFIEEQKSRKQICEELDTNMELVNRITSMVHRAEFKRFQTPPILKITSKSFGTGRRIPIVSDF